MQEIKIIIAPPNFVKWGQHFGWWEIGQDEAIDVAVYRDTKYTEDIGSPRCRASQLVFPTVNWG